MKSGSSFKKQGVYLLPSLLTGAAMLSGFYSILNTIGVMVADSNSFWISGWAIVIAAFLDAMDGRIARLMKVESEFGSQFDSIADIVSFGVAPAVLLYAAFIHDLDRLGLFGAFLFVVCAGIRLARFNVSSQQSGEKKYFKGMASPVAAGGVALLVMVDFPFSLQSWASKLSILGYAVVLSLLMVSNIRFRSFKKVEAKRLRRSQTFMIALLIILIGVVFQEEALLFFFLIYLFWGLVEELALWRRRRKSDPKVPMVLFGDREDEDDSII